MKVLFIYRYLTLGGVEAVLAVRLAELPAHGIEAEAWFLHDYGGRSMFAAVAERVHVGDLQQCESYGRQAGFDVISVIDTEEAMVGNAGTGGPSMVLECHSGYLQNIDYLRKLRERPAAIFAPSQEQRQLVRERIGDDQEVRVVPNPLPRAMTAPLRDFPAPPPRPVVAWVGRLDELKNWEGFLDVGRQLVAAGKEVELWMVGGAIADDGASRLLAAADQRGVAGRLRWLQGLPHGHMPDLLDAVRSSGGVVISTSRRESFGLSVAEAMARGCAVVAPEQQPFVDLVAGEESLYRPGSMVDAAGQVARLLADPALREKLGQSGRERVLRHHAPEVAIAVLAGELRAVAARTPGSTLPT